MKEFINAAMLMGISILKLIVMSPLLALAAIILGILGRGIWIAVTFGFNLF